MVPLSPPAAWHCCPGREAEREHQVMIFVFWDEAMGRRSGQLRSLFVHLGVSAHLGVHVVCVCIEGGVRV